MSTTLATCRLGERQRVDSVGGGRAGATSATDHATRRRLAELGIRPGARVVAVSATAGSGRVVAVSESRIALDRATAAIVLVSADAAPPTDHPTASHPTRPGEETR